MKAIIPICERLIISAFDYTGEWAEPYISAGYPVMLWDKKIEGCILEGFSKLLIEIEESGLQVYGFLFAPPCTDFAGSGARWWNEKDKDCKGYEPFNNTTELSEALIRISLHLVDIFNPFFWVMENPIGRLESIVPELKPFRKMIFNPCDYGDAYTKKTILWGDFNTSLQPDKVEPIMYELNGKKGSYMWAKLGGKSERTKALRTGCFAMIGDRYLKDREFETDWNKVSNRM